MRETIWYVSQNERNGSEPEGRCYLIGTSDARMAPSQTLVSGQVFTVAKTELRSRSYLAKCYATVFQAKMVTIMQSAQTALSIGRTGKCIRICSDSQAAIKALGAPIVALQLTLGCRQTLETLAMDNKITLVWTPNHSGIKDNEKANMLAKTGSKTKLLSPEPALGVPFCLGRRSRTCLRIKT